MNKAELINAMAAESGLSKVDSKKALEAFFSSVTKALSAGDKISLVGFGTFSVAERSARMGINPSTKKAIEILNEKGIGDEMVKEANSKVTAYSKFPLDPYFEHNDLKANPDGVYYKVFGKLFAGNTTSAEAAEELLKGIDECYSNY